MKKILAIILTAALAPGVSAAEPAVELALTRHRGGALGLPHPPAWRIEEFDSEGVARITAVPPETASEPGFVPVVIDMSRRAHAALGIGGEDTGPETVLEEYLRRFLRAGAAQVLQRRETPMADGRAALVEITAGDDLGGRHHLYVWAAVRGDYLATLFCEAPPALFESYRPLFDAVVLAAQPFIDLEPVVPGHAAEEDSGREPRAARSIPEIPFDPAESLTLGGLYLEIGLREKALGDAEAARSFRRAEEELRRACGASATALNALCAYTLGKLFHLGHADPASAIHYYRRASELAAPAQISP